MIVHFSNMDVLEFPVLRDTYNYNDIAEIQFKQLIYYLNCYVQGFDKNMKPAVSMVRGLLISKN